MFWKRSSRKFRRLLETRRCSLYARSKVCKKATRMIIWRRVKDSKFLKVRLLQRSPSLWSKKKLIISLRMRIWEGSRAKLQLGIKLPSRNERLKAKNQVKSLKNLFSKQSRCHPRRLWMRLLTRLFQICLSSTTYRMVFSKINSVSSLIRTWSSLLWKLWKKTHRKKRAQRWIRKELRK